VPGFLVRRRRRRRRRRWWWSLLVKIEGDPLNTQHAQHREEEEEIFTRENRVGSAQHSKRATPLRSSHGPMRALPCAIPIYSSAVAFIHVTLPAPSRMGTTFRTVQTRRDEEAFADCATVVMLCAW